MGIMVKIIEKSTESVLTEYPFEQLQEAYAYAAELEENGLDIEVIAPTVTETLCDSLGMDLDAQEDYKQSVFNEIHDHEGCCAEES